MATTAVGIVTIAFLMSTVTFYNSDEEEALEQRGEQLPLYNSAWDITNTSLNEIFEKLGNYKEMVNCDNLVNSNIEAMRLAKRWNFNSSEVWPTIYEAPDRCAKIRGMFAFINDPLSPEEESYALAYGMLVYQNSLQILYMLSALYQPQNQFCIAIDCKASEEFMQEMETIAGCFGNIHILYVPRVQWCGFTVVKAVFTCLEFLNAQMSDWKYYQYLSGGDLPLKTNLEMVRIFKALNGSFNSVIADYPAYRAMSPHKPPPFTLWKSSLSATFSRQSADYIVKSPQTAELLSFLSKTECSDESIWTTLAGNMHQLPGSFNAWSMRSKILEVLGTLAYARGRTEFGLYQPQKYYISRFQVWSNVFMPCYGKNVRGSCSYGVRDIPGLLARPELVAHKFDLDFQPAAFFCLF
ncbi:hypothetical protein QR680_016052 [Steinernema hermaphroditum]|uniref:Protein xylosyltransferase n=1 Tax=Steinernema hermaphroditum TaxID=289476 RepID=A0AA39HCE5_9BILA|nr:hypothetical protein QR680_016052 [Steinernema hermaphroditum]